MNILISTIDFKVSLTSSIDCPCSYSDLFIYSSNEYVVRDFFTIIPLIFLFS